VLLMTASQITAAKETVTPMAPNRIQSIEQGHLLNDPPPAHLRALRERTRADTTWFGGFDPFTGLAYEGGIWDFEDGTLQGWTSIDLTDEGLFFRHVTADSFIAHDDPPPYAVITQGGSEGSAWCGAFLDEAREGCWPGGRGYSNNWGQHLKKSFVYGGSGTITIDFDYFVDSETDFDFTYVYVIDDAGLISDPLNTCGYPNEQGYGYSGAVREGTAIGSPDNPAHDTIIVDTTWLPDSASAQIEIQFSFYSDPLYSDGLDTWGGYLNTWWGPFGVDNVLVTGVDLADTSDFEPVGDEYDGWQPDVDPAVGRLLKVGHLDDLEPIGDACDCEVEGHAMLAADTDPNAEYPHPWNQNERLMSNAFSTMGVDNLSEVLIRWDHVVDLPRDPMVGFRATMHYYPWTCPSSGSMGWTLEPAGDGGVFFEETPTCGTWIRDNSQYLPSGSEFPDSLKVVVDMLQYCDDFGWPPPCDPAESNQTPYWDNVRVGFTTAVNAPLLHPDSWFQDGYPQANTLRPDATTNIDSFFDRNYSDSDQTNADMGDSATVDAGSTANSEVYLNFRVRPGPCMDSNDPYWTRFHCDDQPGGAQMHCPVDCRLEWAAARCDSAERQGGNSPLPGRFMTFFHEESRYFSAPEGSGSGPDWRLNRANEILPDGFFTPGTIIEYFFSSHFNGNPWDADHVDTWPDTTGSFFLEVEVLPGYVADTESTFVAPCLLYVDAFNRGAQIPIEEWGLRPTLGTLTDLNGQESDNWDRYDYNASSTNIPGPLARETYGNNGMTKYQSMIYRTILYNTGTRLSEGLRDGDAELLMRFLTTDDFDRWSFLKGLWLSGDGIAAILDNPVRPNSMALLEQYASCAVVCDCLNEPNCPGGTAQDSSLCLRVEAAPDAVFGEGAPEPYAAIRGHGCPSLYCMDLLSVVGDGVANLRYVDQDVGGQPHYCCASVSTDRSTEAGHPENYRVVLDAFSLHHLRWQDDPGWSGADCGTDSSAISRRTADVLAWLGAGTEGCDVADLLVGAEDDENPAAALGPTRLRRNAPNPFNPTTTVRYVLAEDAHVRLEVFDVTGARCRVLFDAVQTAGGYAISWDGLTDDGHAAASGVFWIRMSTKSGFKDATKIVLVR